MYEYVQLTLIRGEIDKSKFPLLSYTYSLYNRIIYKILSIDSFQIRSIELGVIKGGFKMAKNLWRKEIDQLTPYVPGKPIEDVKREYGITDITRLASNESPYGPSPKAVDAMKEAVHKSWLYPEPTCRNLREKLATRHDLSPEQFVIGNGADHLITLIGHAFINKGDEVIYGMPTFMSYRESTLSMGGIPVEVPLTDDFVYDLDAIEEAITENTKLVYICNPNNPTGTILDSDQIVSFLEKVPSHVLVILDEAYIDFITEKDYRTGVELIKEDHRLISLRTFSKLHGLAGTRVGFAIGNEEILSPLKAVRPTFEVNRIAIAGAEASLDNPSYSEKVLEKIVSETERLSKVYNDYGFDVIGTHANFMFIDVKQDAGELTEALLKKGLIVRPCAPWGLKTHLRITVGTPEQNNHLIEAIKDIMELENI